MNISLYTHRLKEAILGKKKLIAANKWLKNATYNWRAGAVILTLRICLQDPTQSSQSCSGAEETAFLPGSPSDLEASGS